MMEKRVQTASHSSSDSFQSITNIILTGFPFHPSTLNYVYHHHHHHHHRHHHHHHNEPVLTPEMLQYQHPILRNLPPITFYYNSHILPFTKPLPIPIDRTDKPTILQLYVRCIGLSGGKGGFGAILRGSRGKNLTTNFSSCRNLNGRRLREVEEMKRVKEWKEKNGGASGGGDDDGDDGDVGGEMRKRRKVVGNEVREEGLEKGVEIGMEEEGMGQVMMMEEKVDMVERKMASNAERVLDAVTKGMKIRLRDNAEKGNEKKMDCGEKMCGANDGKEFRGKEHVEETGESKIKENCAEKRESAVKQDGKPESGRKVEENIDMDTVDSKVESVLKEEDVSLIGESSKDEINKKGKHSQILKICDIGECGDERKKGEKWATHFEGLDSSSSEDEDESSD